MIREVVEFFLLGLLILAGQVVGHILIAVAFIGAIGGLARFFGWLLG